MTSTDSSSKAGFDGLPSTPRPPLLLVSVRSACEARAALAGGCDVVDVKEPSRGPLGMADATVIHETADILDQFPGGPPLSVALGEVRDWDARRATGVSWASRASIVKAGSAGLNAEELRGRLGILRDSFDGQSRAVSHVLDNRHWVAVAYADSGEAGSPSPEEVLEVAAELRFSGLLIDTWSKIGRSLFGCLSIARLGEIRDAAVRRGLWLALAGRLSLVDVASLVDLAPHVVGIRSAACAGGLRDGVVCPERVAEFRSALASQYKFQESTWWSASTRQSRRQSNPASVSSPLSKGGQGG